MKLANVVADGIRRVVLVLGEELVDLTAALGVGPQDVMRLLAMGDEGRSLVERCIKAARPRLSVPAVTFEPPVLKADKILGVGMNYHSFVAAAALIGFVAPTERLWFYRPASCLTGPYDDIWLPRDAQDLDYEAELAVVIGRRCRHVSPGEAAAMVAGFTIANDLTLRERVMRSVVLGKSFDTHTPLGPWLVTPEEIGDPHDLGVRTWVNGELRQDSRTSDMISSCYELVAAISAVSTLNPGDIILTGTPDGCGAFRRPMLALAADDVVKIEIEGIGVIENRVVDEPEMA